MVLSRFSVCALTFCLANCATVTNPTAPGILFQGRTQLQNNTDALIAAFQIQNATLIRTSGGAYQCNDPKNKLIKQYLKLSDKEIAAFVKNEFNDNTTVWYSSLQLIQTYADTFNKIDTQKRADQATLNTLSTAYNGFLSLISPTGAAVIPAVSTVVNDLRTFASEQQKRKYAKNMRPVLITAVALLQSPKIIGELSGPEQEAFSKWDSCAQETISYMRDLSDPEFAAKYGYDYKRTNSEWHTKLIPPDEGSIIRAHAEYLTARKTYTINIDFKAYLDNILIENDKIIASAQDFSLGKINSIAQDVCNAANAFAKAGGRKSNECTIPTFVTASQDAGDASIGAAQ